jgi:long-chain acyl-CoA synthetase
LVWVPTLVIGCGGSRRPHGPVAAELNGRLAQHETIKSFAVLPQELSVERGEMTPSLKAKRRALESNYGHLLDELYPNTTRSL